VLVEILSVINPLNIFANRSVLLGFYSWLFVLYCTVLSYMHEFVIAAFFGNSELIFFSFCMTMVVDGIRGSMIQERNS